MHNYCLVTFNVYAMQLTLGLHVIIHIIDTRKVYMYIIIRAQWFEYVYSCV